MLGMSANVSGGEPGKRSHITRIISTAHKGSVKGLPFLNGDSYSNDTAILCPFIQRSPGILKVNKGVPNTQ